MLERIMVLETQFLDRTLLTTAELVVAAQGGDNEAFGELVSRFERMVQAVCYQRLRNHAEAQEAAVRRSPAVAVEPHTLEGVGASGGEGPLGSLLARERVDQLHEGLDRLAKLDRSTLVAFYIEGQSLVEMSDEFAAPIGTIKRRLHVARKRLAKELECLQAV
jgi:RNA polymerase sigma-70 factor (ECF subfamily)